MKALDPMQTPPQAFSVRGWETQDETGAVFFRYSFDNGLSFRETIDFGRPLPPLGDARRAKFEAALNALSIALGVSYYKAFVPKTIELGDAAAAEQIPFFRKLFTKGLAEFAYRNRLGSLDYLEFSAAGQAHRPSGPEIRPADRHPGQAKREPGSQRSRRVDFLRSRIRLRLSGMTAEAIRWRLRSLLRSENGKKDAGRVAVLVGGGKDSLVSVEMLRSKADLVLFAVNPKKPILECAEASGLPSIFVTRKLDPALFDLNARGALNGHVPITAIVSLIAVAASYVHGYRTIVLSNERSANEGNVVSDGQDVNHQYSKSIEFEEDFAAYLSAYVDPDLSYFSLLRLLSELHIAQLFSRVSRYDHCFTSCNRSFQINPAAPPARWCCDCPKCRFSFLIFATAMAPDRLRAIFGADLLAEGRQLPGYEELTGLSGHKPWECVGELAESSLALLLLAGRPEWADHHVVKALAPRLRPKMPDMERVREEFLTPSDNHRLPVRFKDMMDAYIRGG
jgi:UDP-N-acetyl-alpha-D-muramoyl-L-alanyl-L-glutamate epimerase